MNNPNFYIWGPLCFIIAFLFYNSSKMVTGFENKLRDKEGNINPIQERWCHILRRIFVTVALCFCVAGILLLLYFGLK